MFNQSVISLEWLNILQPLIHYGLHFLFPGLIAWLFFRKEWKKVWLIMLATMLVDLDHLLADPIFDPQRCGIGFHPLHSYYAIAVYFLIFFFSKIRIGKIVALGLLFHMFTDFQDCIWIKYIN